MIQWALLLTTKCDHNYPKATDYELKVTEIIRIHDAHVQDERGEKATSKEPHVRI